jgi:hypothetical protein
MNLPGSSKKDVGPKKKSGSGDSLFDQVKKKIGGKREKGESNSLSQTEERILGPSYDYVKKIKTPGDLEMSAEGSFDVLAKDIGGLLAYIDLLVSGNGTLGVGSKTPNPDGTFSDYKQPLGNKFFLRTAVKCKDEDGKEHDRSIYVNNVPDGRIPLVSNLDDKIAFKDFRGLLPGVLSNLAQIRPMQILSAFVTGSSPTCQAVTMEVIDKDNKSKLDTRYLTNDDIAIMPDSWFPESIPQSSYDIDKEAPEEEEPEEEEPEEEEEEDSFCTMNGPNENKKRDYSKMPDDIGIKIYFSMLGLLGIYILLRLMIKKKK